MMISVLLTLTAVPAFAADQIEFCKCVPVVREGRERNVNLWVYWTDASGQPHHDVVGVFGNRGECRAEAAERACPLR